MKSSGFLNLFGITFITEYCITGSQECNVFGWIIDIAFWLGVVVLEGCFCIGHNICFWEKKHRSSNVWKAGTWKQLLVCQET